MYYVMFMLTEATTTTNTVYANRNYNRAAPPPRARGTS